MKQALLLVFMLAGGLLSAQSNLDLKFQPDTPRRVIELTSEYTEVTVCNLTVGETYSMASGYISSDNPCSFGMGITKNSFSGNLMFVADETCESFWFRKTCDGDIEAYLSLVCQTCTAKEKGDHPEQGVDVTTYSGDLLALVQEHFIGGNCFDVSNVTFSGGPNQIGTFSNGESAMGLGNGITLSSGNVNLAEGPNASGAASAVGGGGNSDPDLNTLTSQPLRDVAVLEFDFIPTTDLVQFDFVFGSEEYCEWVNSAYNDVFGFFISGPGITGSQNIALVPGTGDAITINTVNNGTNPAFFVPNSNGCGAGAINNDIEFDGYTTVLTASAVIPDTSCQVYHLRLAIADGTDNALDSGVFLKKGSFNAGSEFEVIAGDLISGTDETVEGCGDAYFRFYLLEESKYPTTVNFTVVGTATSGVDFAPLPTSIVIPAEVLYVDLPVTIFADGIPEGLETIELLIDANVCSCLNPTVVLNITEPDPIILQSFDTVLCQGSGTLTLDPSAVGGAPPLSYSWSPISSTDPTLDVPGSTGSYTVTVTDACGGTAETTWNITETAAPTVAIFGDGTICNGGFVDIFLSFTGNGPWTVDIYKDNILWNTYTFLTSNVSFSTTEIGVYTVQGVSTAGCNGPGSGSATISNSTLQSTAIILDELCVGENDGSIEVVPIIPGSYSYNWSPIQPDNPLIDNLTPGTYDLTITDASGCTATETYVVDAAVPLVVDSSSTGVDCLNPKDGTIDLVVSGGEPNYSYIWDNLATTPSIFGLNPGTYAFTVTDANGCEVVGTETVEEGDGFPIAIIEPAGTIDCNNQSIFLSGNGSSTSSGTTYNWTTSDGSIVSGGNSLTPEINLGGTYTLIVTNALGCVKDTSITVLDDLDEPIADVTALGQLDCDNPTLTLIDNGSSTGPEFSYAWTTSNGNIVSGGSSLTPVVDAAGNYTLVITDSSNGCTSTIDVPISGDITSPVSNAGSTGLITCINKTINLDGTGSSTGSNIDYQWTTTDGSITNGSSTLSPEIDSEGTYYLIVTNGTNGCADTSSVVITEDLSEPLVDAMDPLVIGCLQSNISLSGSFTPNNASFNWVTSNGNFVTGTTTVTPEVDAAGDYTIIVTHPVSGCTSESTVSVSLDQNTPTADAGPMFSLTCAVTSVNLDATINTSQGAGYSYQWTTANGNIVNGSTSLTPEVNLDGEYQLVVTDASNGCTSLSTVNVGLDDTDPIADVVTSGQVDCNSSNVTFTDNGSSTGPEFSYVWTTTDGNLVSGQNSLTPVIDLAGTYTLLVTNSTNGCTATIDVPVSADTIPPLAVANVVGELSCIDTVLTLDGAGSSTGNDYSYSWTTTTGNIVSGNSTLNPVVNQQGTYQLIVTNSQNGCTNTESVTITENLDVGVADAGNPVVIGCLQPTVLLSGSFTPNTASFDWVTSNGNFVTGTNTLTPEIDAQGDYTLIVTHPVSGCTVESTVTASLDQNTPVSDAGISDDLACNVFSVNLDATANTSQGAGYTYQWTTTDGNIVTGSTTLTPEVNMDGTYKLIVTDGSNGCTSVSTVIVGVDDQDPIADVSASGQVDCNSANVTFVDNGSSTGSEFSYSWTTSNGNLVSGQNSLTPVIDLAGTYTLLVTNSLNGCTSTIDVPVSADTLSPMAFANVLGELTCTDTILTLDGVGSSTGNEYTYNWTTTNGNIVSGETSMTPSIDQQGNYQIVVTNNNNGCTSASDVIVAENLDVAIPNAGTPTTIGCTQTTAQLSGSITPINASFEWTTSNGSIVMGASTLTPQVNSHGDYTLIATHPVSGCTSESTVTVGLDQNVPVADAGLGSEVTCDVLEITLNGSNSSQGGNYSYNWTTTDGNIVLGESSLNPTVNQDGVYQLVVTDDSNGCTSLSTVTIGLNNQDPLAEPGIPSTIDCNIPVVTLGPSMPSGNTNLSYSWTTSNGNILSGATSENPEVNQDGLYVLVVTDITNGCTSDGQVLINEDIAAPTVGLTGDDEITCTIATSTINATASSAGPVTYSWTTSDGFIQFGDGTDAITVTQAGTYVLDILNTDNGCSIQDSFLVTTNANFPTAIAAPQNELTCVLDTTGILGFGSSTGNQFVYSWTTADGNIISSTNILDVVVDEPGTYVLGVTDITNNCASSFSVSVVENTDLPTVNAGNTQTLLCGVDSLQLAGSGTAGGSTVEYMWTTQDGAILSGNTTSNPYVNASGTYYLSVTDMNNGCSSLDSVLVDQDINIPTVDAGLDMILNCQVDSVELGTTVTSSGSNFNYQWIASNGGVLPTSSNTPFITVTSDGTYELQVTNTDNGCKAISVVVIGEDTVLPIIDPGVPSELNCLVDTALVGGLSTSTGAEFSYLWTTPDGNILSGMDAMQAQVDQPGDYNIVVVNSDNFCESQYTLTVTENIDSPVISIATPSIITCTNPTVELSGSGSSVGSDFEYLWTTTSGNIISGDVTLGPEVNQPGFYTLLVLNNLNGCTTIDSIQVNKDDSQPTAVIEPAEFLTCDVFELVLDASGSSSGGNYTYSWTTTNGNIVSGATSLEPEIDLPGDYHLEITDNSNNCTSFADITVIEDIALPIAEAGQNETIYCGDSTVTLDGTGTNSGANYSYIWTTLDGNIINGATTLFPDANEVGTYYLSVENTINGCQSLDSVVIVADVNAPIIVLSNSPQLTCDVLELAINATNSSSGSDFDYSWSTTDGSIVSGAKSNNPVVDAKGTYLLKLVNLVNGCESTKEVTIEQNIQEPTIDGSVDEIITCAVDEVDITSSASGSGSIFEYQWSSDNGNIVYGDMTSTPKVNAQGTYIVIVKDLSNGCTSERPFVVNEDTLEPSLVLSNPNDITCKQLTVALNASSNSNVTFDWTTSTGNIVSGANSSAPVVDKTGDYQVVIVDADNGCTTLNTIIVNENIVVPNADAGDDLDIPCTSNSVQIGPVAGNPNYNYSWSTTSGLIVSGGNSLNPVVSSIGNYVLEVEDNVNGCISEDYVIVAAPPKVLDLDFDINEATCNGFGGSVQIVEVIGGTPPYLYSFDNGNNFGTLDLNNGLVSGSYNVVVQDVLGCEYETQAIVPAAVLPVISTNQIYYIEAGDSAQLEVFTSILPNDIDTIIWDPIESLSCTNCLNPIAKPLNSTNYDVLVRDKDGCDASAKIAIFVSDPEIYIPNVFSPNSSNLENSSFYVHAKPNKVKEITTLFIADRWGNLVFQQDHFLPNDPYTGWDGSFRGETLSPGVYVYHAVIELVSGKKVSYSGDVTIVK